VGVLRLRAADLMWYAAMIALISFSVTSLTLLFTGVLSGLALTVFILPFFGLSSLSRSPAPLCVAISDSLCVRACCRQAKCCVLYRCHL
jgi:hypothetical protein